MKIALAVLLLLTLDVDGIGAATDASFRLLQLYSPQAQRVANHRH